MRLPLRRFVDTGVFFFLVLALAAPVEARVQQPGVIAGSVVASTSGEPLAGATVTVQRAGDTTAVASVATTEQGRFRVTGLATGVYGVRIAFLGYTEAAADSVVITAESPERELTVRLQVAPVELDAIEAQTERAPVQILTDRTVYTTKDMPASTGGTATDLLRQVPELEVDVNGKVTLRGNQSVSIHLNGRPAPLQGDALANFLQQMPADRIAKVEVMPNPTARHDPEGTGGIVNIILAEDVDLGLSGSLTARGGSRGQRGFNGRLAYQKGRLTFFGGVGLNYGEDTSDTWDVRRNLLASPVTVLEQEGQTSYDNLFSMFDLTAEYKLAEKTTAWLSGTGWGGGSNNSSAMVYGLYDDARLVLDRYDRITDSEHDNGTTDFAVGVKHVFEAQRHELTADLRRNAYGNGGESYVEKLSRLDPDLAVSEIRSTDQDSDNRGTTLRVDYTRPLGEKGRIDIGLNIGRRALDEESLQEVFGATDPTMPIEREDSRFRYSESFNSLYVTAAQTFGDFGVQLGLRGEIADTEFSLRTTDETFDNDYRSLFPSANLSYTLAQGQTLRLNYAKRISRPYSGILNPYVPATDPLNRRVGNPYLDPSYTHSISLDYSRVGKVGTLRVAPSWRRSVNGWETIKRVDENGVSTVTWENTASTEYMGSNFTASLRPVGRFNGSLSFGVYRTITDASNISPEFSRDSWRWSLGGNTTVRITNSLNMQMNGSFSPAREVPQGRISSTFYSGLSVRQQLLDNKATLSLFVNDPLGLYAYEFETRDRTHVQTGRTSYNFRTASLSFTWNFGKPPEQVSRRSGPETTEETIRIR